ncbi:MAG: FAD-dependent oxidoreductase [Acidobacteria bacterium]|nr:FAD-dependent oxidoreductase [Acidobacteriota bacterium]
MANKRLKPRKLVVLGSGFGGYSLIRALRRSPLEVTVVSPRNYFLFTPLLPSAVSGSVEFRSILEPLRRRQRHAHLLEAAAEQVDFDARRVACCSAVGEECFEIEYDVLVLAVGAAVSNYGISGVERFALSLASVEDGRAMRRAVLERFAGADIPGLPLAEVERRLRFVVVGGGPTGVEVAAEIQDLLARELHKAFPALAPVARLVLLEAGERLLGSFDHALSEYTRRHFQREGIEVRTGSPVARIESSEIFFEDGRTLRYGLVIWAGGNAPVPLIADLGLPTASDGRVIVDRYLRVSTRANVYAVGDCAACGDPPLPATAQVAQQQGSYLAEVLRRKGELQPFGYKRRGMLAYIGGGKALADLPNTQWSGRTAWLFWRSVYLTKLVSPANKVKVLFDWIKARLFGRDLSRF